MWLTILFAITTFFSDYHREAQCAINLFNQHSEIRTELCHYLTAEESRMAQAIVMPEVAMYTKLGGQMEYRTLCLMYILHSKAEFSIGLFQMKPSFVEQLEQQLAADKNLKRKYAKLFIHKRNARECRKIRMDRMMQLKWQTRYLAAFVDICKQKTANIHFTSTQELLRHWATLYNAGLHRSAADVNRLQRLKQFPHFRNKYNYADVAWEFYQQLKNTTYK